MPKIRDIKIIIPGNGEVVSEYVDTLRRIIRPELSEEAVDEGPDCDRKVFVNCLPLKAERAGELCEKLIEATAHFNLLRTVLNYPFIDDVPDRIHGFIQKYRDLLAGISLSGFTGWSPEAGDADALRELKERCCPGPSQFEMNYV